MVKGNDRPTNKIRTIIKANSDVTVRSIPYIGVHSAFVVSRTDVCTVGVRAGGISRVAVDGRRNGDVGDFAILNSRGESILPLLGHEARVGGGRWESGSPGGGADFSVSYAIGGRSSTVKQLVNGMVGVVVPSSGESFVDGFEMTRVSGNDEGGGQKSEQCRGKHRERRRVNEHKRTFRSILFQSFQARSAARHMLLSHL